MRSVPHYAVDHAEHDRASARSVSPLANRLRGLATGSLFAGIAAEPYAVYVTGGYRIGDAAPSPTRKTSMTSSTGTHSAARYEPYAARHRSHFFNKRFDLAAMKDVFSPLFIHD
ncbi:hypothetical protein CTZ27_02145 [Streptomyces griseocarneus]|nr:hypothetical protein CTZ27_02145 [Streptomyces griseocarneus]